MPDDNGEKSVLENSIEVLNGFLNAVKKKDSTTACIEQAEHALNYQGKFVEYLKNFDFKENVYRELNELRIRNGISVNFHDALQDFIGFYQNVVEKRIFTPEELQPAWKALEYQFNLCKRMSQNANFNMVSESVCGRRPKTSLIPQEPQ